MGRMSLDRRPRRCTPRPSRAPRPCSGTAPWASLFDNFAHGTQAVVDGAAAELKDNGGTSIIGSGDSVAVNKFDLADKMMIPELQVLPWSSSRARLFRGGSERGWCTVPPLLRATGR